MGKPTPPLSIRAVRAEETVPLRKLVLWPGLPLEDQLRPYDHFPTTVHIGAFLPSTLTSTSNSTSGEDTSLQLPTPPITPLTTPPITSHEGYEKEEMVACLSLVFEPYLGARNLSDVPKTEIQLHKFAVRPDLQGLGVGRAMVAFVMRLLGDTTNGPRVAPPAGFERFAELERPILLHLDSRYLQRGFYSAIGLGVLDEKTWQFRGVHGDQPLKEYIRMGKLIQ